MLTEELQIPACSDTSLTLACLPLLIQHVTTIFRNKGGINKSSQVY